MVIPVPNPGLGTSKKISKILGLQLVPGTTIDFLLKKTQVIPGTKSGVFRYIYHGVNRIQGFDIKYFYVYSTHLRLFN